jgi:hypothetical protein
MWSRKMDPLRLHVLPRCLRSCVFLTRPVPERRLDAKSHAELLCCEAFWKPDLYALYEAAPPLSAFLR